MSSLICTSPNQSGLFDVDRVYGLKSTEIAGLNFVNLDPVVDPVYGVDRRCATQIADLDRVFAFEPVLYCKTAAVQPTPDL